jgi:predicted MPP superfamily phosphohydrolase
MRVVPLVLLAFSLAFASCATEAEMVTRRYSLSSAKITRPVKIGLISDTHSQRFENGGARIADALRAEKVDVIILAGDIVDNVLPLDGTRELLEKIAGIAPLYYVPGNHDYFYADLARAFSLLRSFGVRILRDESVAVVWAGAKIILAGADDPHRILTYDPSYNWRASTARAFSPLKFLPNYKILIAHRPEHAGYFARFGFDLMLSGHTHGGMWRIFPFKNGWYAPTQGIDPTYAGGTYRVGAMTLIVGRGLTTVRPLFPRYNNPTELVIVVLNPPN